jgi:hypothetical protein
VVVLVVAASGACAVAGGLAAPPQVGILDPAGGGVRIAYRIGTVSIQCSFRRTQAVPRLTCAARGPVDHAFATSMDRSRVVFYRAGRVTPLKAVSQAAGEPVYGDYAADPHPRLIELAQGASIGFLGTNVECVAVRDGSAPGIRCLAHGGQGLPGPCCGPNYPLQVGSYGFYLSARRLQELHVVNSGVSTGSGPHPSPYKVVKEWRS